VTPDASEQPVWQGATGRHSGVTGRIRDGAVAERESEQEHECAKQGGANVQRIEVAHQPMHADGGAEAREPGDRE